LLRTLSSICARQTIDDRHENDVTGEKCETTYTSERHEETGDNDKGNIYRYFLLFIKLTDKPSLHN
jgi:hypothetical protein